MKTTFWKPIAALALAATLLVGAATAQTRYPANNGALTDDANALSQPMAADISAYAQAAESAAGVKLHVALVQFLDGEPVQAYADALFTRWELTENDLLLLGATAEDTFAFATGEAVKQKLSDGNLKSLLYGGGFAEAFKTQRYDAAFGAFFPGFNELLAKQYDVKIDIRDWFTAYQQPAAAAQQSGEAQPNGQSLQGTVDNAVQSVVAATSSLWSSTMDSITQTVNSFQADRTQRDENGNGLTPAGWIVLAVIALIIFGQSEPARRARRNHGCGCGPLGWAFSLFGLGALLGQRRDRDQEREERREERRSERRGRDGYRHTRRW